MKAIVPNTCQELLNQNADLQSCNMEPEAVMQTETKGELLANFSVPDEFLRILEFTLISVRCGDQRGYALSAPHSNAADDCVLMDRTQEPLRRGAEAKHLFSCNGHILRQVISDGGQLLRTALQLQQP